jgi:senataxin
MMNAILQPRPELFPGHPDTAPPLMPDCFTPPFINHLHNGFNAPQLAAIQWAAAHTAAGSSEVTSNSSSGGQPWPFTLVQGPPGTGKTHTVWGMLNVIHLVQYQRYYAALLKKLAPGSVSSDEYSISSGGEYYGDGGGTIDEVLQKMDNNLARVLPKLCPKPRMLVCAPSNAATDELLSRVLDRGFIDGEMKQYRPDVARVGVDSQSRAAQAVSVERRTEQLLAMDQTQVVRWLQSLRTKEYTLNQTVKSLQKDLIDAANNARSQVLSFARLMMLCFFPAQHVL